MSTFTEIHSLPEIEQFIEANTLAFIYITQPNCSVCHGLEPQIVNILSQYPKIEAQKVDVSLVPEIAGRFQVFTAPTLLLFVSGKEYIREARFVQTKLLNEKISTIYENMAN